MPGRLSSSALLLAAALIGCGGQRAPATSRHLPANIATPPNDAGLLRIARTGGTAQLLRAGTLAPRSGTEVGGLPAMAHVLGTSSVYDETVYASDVSGRLVAIDLKSQRSRIVPATARQLAATPDGTILGVDSARRPVRLVDRAFASYKMPVDKGTLLLRGPGDLLLAVGNRPGTLQVLNAAGELRHLPIPNGRVAATWVGDLVAVTTDSGVVFVDPSGKPPARKAPPRFVRIKGTPTVAVFSPSGHRLYVATRTGGLVIIDRFSRQLLKELPLSGRPDALRADRSGRWLLAHASVDDSLWAVDVTRAEVVWSGIAPWAEDLPQIINGQTILVRRKNDVVAIDLTGSGSPEVGAVPGGANDLYIMLPWVLKPVATDVAAATRPAAASTPDTARSSTAAPPAAAPGTPTPGSPTAPAAAPATTPAPTATGTIYLQVSSSQNSDWAQALAKQLKDGGFPAKVLDPKTSDESYRVVVGPYANREDADAVGKRLGRPYFIINPGSGDT